MIRLRTSSRQKLGLEMMSGRLALALGIALVLALPSPCQQQTIAKLRPETRTDIPSADIPRGTPAAQNSGVLRDSLTSRAAADALFAKSDLQRARLLTDKALFRDIGDAEALFVRMEEAAIEGDDTTALFTAVSLCELGAYARSDARVRLAAARVREAANNTPEFRRAIPRLQLLLANAQLPWPDLELALLKAAMDGTPGLDASAAARSAGILTDWRVVGPIGARPLLDVDRQLISPADDLTQEYYAGRAVENFQFPDGWVRLPDYLQRHGVFYAAGRFASLTAETRQVTVASAGPLALFVDGQQVLRSDGNGKRETVSVTVVPGPHRVLLKFAASAAPLRVTVSHAASFTHAAFRARLSPQEAVYLLAAEHYADDEFATAAKQIQAEPSFAKSIALQFLSGQAISMIAQSSQSHGRPTHAEVARTVNGSDPESRWAQTIAHHPSCQNLLGAMEFYQSRGEREERTATQQKLETCAPDSLAYARSLAGDGRHAEAAGSLRRLLAGAPLNRDARLMLVSELQLSGNDEAAQRAAADWLRIAPNAPNYHRLAANSAELKAANSWSAGAEFYLPYRRDAATIARRTKTEGSAESALVLLDDRVAIARPDGSVSLYVHTARRWPSNGTAGKAALAEIPSQAQVLTLQVLHADGAATALGSSTAAASAVAILPGDTLDVEYVLHFTGDGGIPQHAEAFQFVFGSFAGQVANARFVVLTPADHGDGGVVIATGGPPTMSAKVRNGMLERVWEMRAPEDVPAYAVGLAIVRVVEQDNGWSVPSDAEHHKRIETIHPGPWPKDS